MSALDWATRLALGHPDAVERQRLNEENGQEGQGSKGKGKADAGEGKSKDGKIILPLAEARSRSRSSSTHPSSSRHYSIDVKVGRYKAISVRVKISDTIDSVIAKVSERVG